MSKNIIYYSHLEDQIQNKWTPAKDLANFEAWYDPSDTSTLTIDTGVSQWDDKTGNGHHLTQGTGVQQPVSGTRTVGGLNVIDFDGAGVSAGGHNMTITSPWDFIGKELHLIGSVDNHTTNNKIYGSSNPSNGQQAGIANDQQNMRIWQGGSNPWSGDNRGPSPTAGVNYIWGFLYRSVEGTFKTFVQDGTVTNTTDDYNGTGTMVPQYIGKGSFDPTYDGIIGEMIITKTGLSDADRQVIEGYLAWKWGLVSKLPSNHLYKLAPPTG